MYSHTEVNFLGQSFQKLNQHTRTQRHTHRDTQKDATECITTPDLRVVIKYKMRMKKMIFWNSYWNYKYERFQ